MLLGQLLETPSFPVLALIAGACIASTSAADENRFYSTRPDTSRVTKCQDCPSVPSRNTVGKRCCQKRPLTRPWITAVIDYKLAGPKSNLHKETAGMRFDPPGLSPEQHTFFSKIIVDRPVMAEPFKAQRITVDIPSVSQALYSTDEVDPIVSETPKTHFKCSS